MIPSVRSFIAGNSGSGKTTLAWHLYLKRMPRYVVIDQTGEWNGITDVEVDTLDELAAAMRQLAPKGKWSISYSNVDDRYEDLVYWLVPVPDISQSPSIAVGGMALLNDEVDLIAPFGPPPRHVRTLYRRSRHAGLSVLSLTSAPGNVSKEVSRQSTHRIALFLDEPADIDYMVKAMRWTPEQAEYWQAWTQRHPHGAAFRETLTGRLLWLRDAKAQPQEREQDQNGQRVRPQPPEQPHQSIEPKADADSLEPSDDARDDDIEEQEPPDNNNGGDETIGEYGEGTPAH